MGFEEMSVREMKAIDGGYLNFFNWIRLMPETWSNPGLYA